MKFNNMSKKFETQVDKQYLQNEEQTNSKNKKINV